MVSLTFTFILTILSEYLTLSNFLTTTHFCYFSVKRKGGSTPDACNLLDDVLESEDDSLLHLGNDNRDNGTKEYQSESEEEQSLDEEQPEETILKKRKASSNLQNLK
ncbi:hypothetical protein HanHA300_Chr17g0642031 [Helianthus annuus]|nr:hypothetical protein HanHA300_Chr17g0642031 [Helianthus annuus]